MDASIQPDQFLVIIGSMKCGTSSLFDYLSQHPAVCPSATKEPEYFTQRQKHRLRARRYEELWPTFNPVVHRYALEGSTGYTKWPLEQGVQQRMCAYGLRPKLIYIVRDPIERIESHVNFVRATSRQRISFEDSYPVDVSRYATQIDPYVETFGRDAIRVVDFAHLRADPNRVCSDLYEWLNLERYTIAEPNISNATATLQKSQLNRVVANSRTLRKAVRAVPPSARRRVQSIALDLFPHRQSHARLSTDRAEEIRRLLKDDVDRLAREWGVDVTTWGFDDVA